MASANKGLTAYVGVTQKHVTSATTLATPDTAHGNYSASSVAPAFGDNDRGSTDLAFAGAFALPVVAASGGIVPTFKMTGYYAGGSTWETWTSTSSPNLSPPSGHTLTFVSYVLVSGGSAN